MSYSLHDCAPEDYYLGSVTDPFDWSRSNVQFVRGHITGYYTDNEGRTRFKGESRAGAAYDQVEIFTPAGVMSAPKKGENVEGVFISLNGDHSQVMFMPTGDSELRQKLPEGWFGIADPQNPNRHLQIDPDGAINVNEPSKNVNVKAAKVITIEGAESVVIKGAQSVTIEGATVKIKGNVQIEGNISHTGSMTTSGTHKASIGTH